MENVDFEETCYRGVPPMTGLIENNSERCCYCGGCVGVCPTLALELDETRLEVFKDKCINCMACVRLCPVGAMEKKGD